jgi:ABC-2 type transport system ATP-binding protein
MYGLQGTILQERIQHCLEFTGLEKNAARRISTFSGGMKRRANLAAGIIHEPKLLFLDEPTVGIDAQSRSLILEKIDQLGSAGTTIIYTTHYLEEAETLCNMVAVIDNGRIITTGDPQQLIRKNNCATLQDLFFQLTGKKIRD